MTLSMPMRTTRVRDRRGAFYVYHPVASVLEDAIAYLGRERALSALNHAIKIDAIAKVKRDRD